MRRPWAIESTNPAASIPYQDYLGKKAGYELSFFFVCFLFFFCVCVDDGCSGYDVVGVCVYDGGSGYDVVGGCVYDGSSAYDDVGGCGFFLYFIHLQKFSLS